MEALRRENNLNLERHLEIFVNGQYQNFHCCRLCSIKTIVHFLFIFCLYEDCETLISGNLRYSNGTLRYGNESLRYGNETLR